jgi:hypothetical protein
MVKSKKDKQGIVISLSGIDEEIYHKVKVYCVDNKITISQFVNEAMKDKLSMKGIHILEGDLNGTLNNPYI